MKPFIAFVVFVLLVGDVILALVIYEQREREREKDKINEDEKQLAARLQEGIDKYNSEAKRLEKLYRERKRMYNPCNYGGHDWEGDGETVVKNVCGDCKHYYNYACKRCGKKKTTTKPVISRWEDEE
jgi:hypothetical protein